MIRALERVGSCEGMDDSDPVQGGEDFGPVEVLWREDSGAGSREWCEWCRSWQGRRWAQAGQRTQRHPGLTREAPGLGLHEVKRPDSARGGSPDISRFQVTCLYLSNKNHRVCQGAMVEGGRVS